jgi:hypothetical protein
MTNRIPIGLSLGRMDRLGPLARSWARLDSKNNNFPNMVIHFQVRAFGLLGT